MNVFKSLNSKVLIKFLLIFLILLLGTAVFLYQSYKPDTFEKQSTKNNLKEIKNIIAKADILFDKSDYDNAYLYYKKAILLCDPIDKYADEYVYSLLSIANLQQNTSDFAACEETLSMVLPHLKKTTKPKFTYNTYTILAYNYYFTYDNYNALLYHKKALKLAPTSFKKSVILNDITLIYEAQKKYKEVIDILEPLATKKIRHETDSVKTDNAYSLLLGNLGYCYYKVGNPKALDLLEKSLKIQLKLKSDFELVGTYNNLAQLHSEKNPKLSKMYAEKQYISACKSNSASSKANSLAMLIEKSEGRELEKYSQAYLKIIDSIIDGRKNAKTQFSILKYESRINKVENLQLKAQQAENELQLERHKKRNIISYIIITFTLGILLFLSLFLSLRGKKEKKEAVYESEMRISNKLQNELANEVYNTLIFAGNKDLGIIENKNHLLDNLDKIYYQTRNISRENSIIITDEKYESTLKEMIAGYKTSNINILVNGLDTINWAKINKNKKIVIYRVLQELFLNMKTHSLASLAIISFKTLENNIIVTYSDNGSGSKNDKIILQKSLQNVENRIKTINGTINFELNLKSGFKVNFNFPL